MQIQLKAATTSIMLAALLALTLAAAHHLDAPDNSADWPTSSELKALQASEAGTQRRQAAAQALCTQERGPQSEARWTPDGDLVCTQRRDGRNTITILEARL